MSFLSRHHTNPYFHTKIAAIIGLALVTFAGPGMTYAAPVVQINLNSEQIRRAGIVTQAVSVPGSGPVVATATGATAAATMGAGDASQHLSGTVVAPTNAVAIVSTVVSGVVQQLYVNSLQQVQAGTPVATLMSQQLMEMQREYLQLSIQARLTRDKQLRDEKLYNDGVVSLARVQESRGSALQAEVAASERHHSLRAAGLSSSAIARLVQTSTLSAGVTVTAGTAGTVQELSVAVGQRIEIGMPIARISRNVAPWIELQASREQAALIRRGDVVQIQGCGAATVIAISTQVSGANQSTLVRAQQTRDDGCLKLNQFVEARHVNSRIAAGSVGVPAAAIVRNGGQSFVFVANEKGFAAVPVVVASGAADQVWVSGKLSAGSAVAVKGLVALKGAWIGLGAEEAPAPKPAPVPAAVAKKTGAQ